MRGLSAPFCLLWWIYTADEIKKKLMLARRGKLAAAASTFRRGPQTMTP